MHTALAAAFPIGERDDQLLGGRGHGPLIPAKRIGAQ